jgi:uncharacterized protein (DUF58 family)
MDPKELLKKVRAIQIKASRMVDDVLAGEYSSVFKGRGMEFDEVRQYVPGDEIRTIDWNVTARTGVPHVKRFVEERELTVVLLVDLSSSGRFGTVKQLKSEVAAEICALLAFSAIRNQDKVGLILFTDRIEKYVPPKKGKKHVLRVIRELLDHRPRGGETDIGGALEYLSRVIRKRAVVFLVSDFLADPAAFEKPLKLAGRRHDLIAIGITDPREMELPSLGLLELEDIETGEAVVIDSRSLRIRAGFQKRGREASEERRDLFRRIDVDQISVATDRPYLESILRFFKMRERRCR